MEYIRRVADESVSEERVHKTFRKKRLYPIRSNIGSFPLARYSLKDFKNETWLHWEYYAMGCPLWKGRLEEFSGTLDHEKKEIEFPGEDSLDTFYEKYGFDFDEQPKEVQDMSLINIEQSDWSEWYYSVFDTAPIVNLPIGFSYLY